MRTFKDIQMGMSSSITTLIKSFEKQRTQGLISDSAAESRIQTCQEYIENIEEVTTIVIGSETNALIRGIQKEYQLHLAEYYQNFEKFINKYVIGFEGNPGIAESECRGLGVGVKELSCFKGRNPIDGEAEDMFRQIVNANFGTNIPMRNTYKQLLQDSDIAERSGDEIAKAKAYVALMEAQRDAGILCYGGGNYHLLSTDQTYLEAQAKCSGRKL